MLSSSTSLLSKAVLRASKSGVTRSAGARFMSVSKISSNEEITKFTQDHPKALVYFTAQWCGPCKAIGPILDKLSDVHTNVQMAKVDVDESNEAAMEHEITGVPTFLLYEGGAQIQKMVGADPNKLESEIKALDAK